MIENPHAAAYRKNLEKLPEAALDRLCKIDGIDCSHPLMKPAEKIEALVMANNAMWRFIQDLTAKGPSR